MKRITDNKPEPGPAPKVGEIICSEIAKEEKKRKKKKLTDSEYHKWLSKYDVYLI